MTTCSWTMHRLMMSSHSQLDWMGRHHGALALISTDSTSVNEVRSASHDQHLG